MLGALGTTFDVIVIALNTLLAVAALGVNLWAYRSGFLRFRPIHAAVAMLSLIYVLGYGHLLIFQPDAARWSSVMRGVSLLAWPVAWCGPAIASIRAWRAIADRVRTDLDEQQ